MSRGQRAIQTMTEYSLQKIQELNDHPFLLTICGLISWKWREEKRPGGSADDHRRNFSYNATAKKAILGDAKQGTAKKDGEKKQFDFGGNP